MVMFLKHKYIFECQIVMLFIINLIFYVKNVPFVHFQLLDLAISSANLYYNTALIQCGRTMISVHIKNLTLRRLLNLVNKILAPFINETDIKKQKFNKIL